jgi:glycosyltransferase involved in cell wall biosynthesis
MRVLLVSPSYLPNLDGVSMAASGMVRACLRRGWHVEVLTLTIPGQPRPTWMGGAQIIECHQDTKSDQLICALTGRSLTELFRNGQWDVMVFHTYNRILDLALAVADEVNSGKVLISHGFAGLIWDRSPRFPWGLGMMLRRCWHGFLRARRLHAFHRLVFLSKHSDLKGFYDHTMARLWRHPGRRVVPNGVDPLLLGRDPAGFRARFQIAPHDFLFLCVANYSPRKDQGYAAKAFRQARIPNARLIFIGSSLNQFSHAFQQEERALAEEDRLEDVIWLEQVSREETLEAFAACDAFVLSANNEAQPISLLEAMRESKPWIARRSGCIHLMEGGWCVDTQEQMQLAMQRLVADPAEAARLGQEGGKAIQETYHWLKTDEAHCRILEEAAAEARVAH